MRTEGENQAAVTRCAKVRQVLHSKSQPVGGAMKGRLSVVVIGLFAAATLATLQAAAVSKQQADLFARKVAQIVGQADRIEKPGTRRTSVSETELNSWFAYSAKPLLPAGVADPHITMVGDGKLAGNALVDLDTIAKKKQSGGTFDLWNLVVGKVPVNVTGTLSTTDGHGS